MTFVAGIALLLLGAVLAFWMKPDEELEDPADGERVMHTPPIERRRRHLPGKLSGARGGQPAASCVLQWRR